MGLIRKNLIFLKRAVRIKIVKNLHKIPPSVAFLIKLKAVLVHNFYHYAQEKGN